MGNVFLGYGDAVVGIVKGVGNVIIHPIDTVNGIGHSIAHPIDTVVAIKDDIVRMTSLRKLVRLVDRVNWWEMC